MKTDVSSLSLAECAAWETLRMSKLGMIPRFHFERVDGKVYLCEEWDWVQKK